MDLLPGQVRDRLFVFVLKKPQGFFRIFKILLGLGMKVIPAHRVRQLCDGAVVRQGDLKTNGFKDILDEVMNRLAFPGPAVFQIFEDIRKAGFFGCLAVPPSPGGVFIVEIFSLAFPELFLP